MSVTPALLIILCTIRKQNLANIVQSHKKKIVIGVNLMKKVLNLVVYTVGDHIKFMILSKKYVYIVVNTCQAV